MAGKKKKGASPGTSPYFEQPATRATRSSTKRKKNEEHRETGDSSLSADQSATGRPAKKRERTRKSKPAEEDESQPSPTPSAPILEAEVVKELADYPTASNFSSDEGDDDDDVDWEEVPGTQGLEEVSTLLSGTLPSQAAEAHCISVDILKEKPGRRQQPSQRDQLNKLLDKMMRELQRRKHKVHLLGLVSNAMHISSICNEEFVQAVAMSYIPSQYLNKTCWPRKDIEAIFTWFSSVFTVECDVAAGHTSAGQMTTVLRGLQSRVFRSHLDFVLAIVSCLRVLHITTRLVLSLQPCSLKWTRSRSSTTSSPGDGQATEEEIKRMVALAMPCSRRSRERVKLVVRTSSVSSPVATPTSLATNHTATEMPSDDNGRTDVVEVSSSTTDLAAAAAVVAKPTSVCSATVGQCSSDAGVAEDPPPLPDSGRSHECAAAAGTRPPARKARATAHRKATGQRTAARKLRCVAVSRSSQSIHSSNSEGVADDRPQAAETPAQSKKESRRATRASKAAPALATRNSDKSPELGDQNIEHSRPSRRRKRVEKKVIDASGGSSGDESASNSDSDFVPSQPMRTTRKRASQSQAAPATETTQAAEHQSDEASSDSVAAGSDSDFQVLKKTMRRSSSSQLSPRAAADRRGARKSPVSSVAGSTAVPKDKATTLSPVPSQLRRSSKSKRSGTKEPAGVDCWLEVYLDADQSWMSVDPVLLKSSGAFDLAANASQPLSYVIAVDNKCRVKDITQRYAHDWMTRAKRRRVDVAWWQEVMMAYAPLEQELDLEEDLCMQAELESQPLPTSMQDFKGHPLYVLHRHLLKFEGLYPPDLPPIGFLKTEAVYPRSAVHTLHTRETWMKDARSVKEGELPYKMVKARPKRNTPAHERGKIFAQTFGIWQTQDYVPPTATDGIVPRNAYGNVELFKPTMLPFGCRHIKDIPNLPRVARKLGIDCAEAMVGWDQHSGYSHPIFDGVVVCEEFADTLLDAWEADRAEGERKAEEKREKRILDHWYKLTKGLLIQQRVKKMFSLATQEKAARAESGSGDEFSNNLTTDDCEPSWSALQPGCQLPS